MLAMNLNLFDFVCLGKGEEQRAAASLACLLCIQLGSGIESEEVFKTLKPIFKTILTDGSANIQARQAVSSSSDHEFVSCHFLLLPLLCIYCNNAYLLLSVQCATSLGLCTLVAEDDILVSARHGICIVC